MDPELEKSLFKVFDQIKSGKMTDKDRREAIGALTELLEVDHEGRAVYVEIERVAGDPAIVCRKWTSRKSLVLEELGNSIDNQDHIDGATFTVKLTIHRMTPKEFREIGLKRMAKDATK